MPRRPPSATGGRIPEQDSGRVEGRKRGPNVPGWGSDPRRRARDRYQWRALDRLHGRIPQAGPCSTFADPLLRPSALTWDAASGTLLPASLGS